MFEFCCDSHNYAGLLCGDIYYKYGAFFAHQVKVNRPCQVVVEFLVDISKVFN